MQQLKIRKLKFNRSVNIDLSEKDYSDINKSILFLNNKYKKELDLLFNPNNKKLKNYNYNFMKKNIIKSKQIVIDIIRDTIYLYKDNMKNAACVFITGSYARGTNKISSDIDLHIFYKKKVKNFLYEEIISYIITSVLHKARDTIDPTFILNFKETKKKIDKRLNNSILNISLNSKIGKINYSYKQGKKRRFYLQYLNSRKLSELKKYITKGIYNGNKEYNHCFEIIYGKDRFNKIYDYIYANEIKLIKPDYIIEKIDYLVKNINCAKKIMDKRISSAKKIYQGYHFELIYEYFSILRFQLIYNGKRLCFFNLFEIMHNYNDKKELFNQIYKYLWLVEKFSNYCIINEKEYSLHGDETINYDFSLLNKQWEIIKKSIILDLKGVRKKYEKSNTNPANDAC